MSAREIADRSCRLALASVHSDQDLLRRGHPCLGDLSKCECGPGLWVNKPGQHDLQLHCETLLSSIQLQLSCLSYLTYKVGTSCMTLRI